MANQAGFRKGMGIFDQVYILNYLINRQLREGIKKMTVVYIDLKAAFDSVDKEVLAKIMREKGVKEGLVVKS